MNENYELMLGDGGNLFWFPENDARSMTMMGHWFDDKMALNIGQVEEEYVDVVQDVLKKLKQLREGHGQWETHWEFLHAWLEEIADGHISGNDVLKVMDELKRGNGNER